MKLNAKRLDEKQTRFVEDAHVAFERGVFAASLQSGMTPQALGCGARGDTYSPDRTTDDCPAQSAFSLRIRERTGHGLNAGIKQRRMDVVQSLGAERGRKRYQAD